MKTKHQHPTDTQLTDRLRQSNKGWEELIDKIQRNKAKEQQNTKHNTRILKTLIKRKASHSCVLEWVPSLNECPYIFWCNNLTRWTKIPVLCNDSPPIYTHKHTHIQSHLVCFYFYLYHSLSTWRITLFERKGSSFFFSYILLFCNPVGENKVISKGERRTWKKKRVMQCFYIVIYRTK